MMPFRLPDYAILSAAAYAMRYAIIAAIIDAIIVRH